MLSRSTRLLQLGRTSYHSLRLLSTFDKHKSVFDTLGLSKTNNKGVFDGEWKGSGPIVPSYNPVNNQIIAEVITVCVFLFSHDLWLMI